MTERLIRFAARVPGLTLHERAVLFHLADRAGRATRQCAKSASQIAEYCRMSNRQVYRALATLRAKHLISVVGRTYSQVTIHRVELGIPAAEDNSPANGAKKEKRRG